MEYNEKRTSECIITYIHEWSAYKYHARSRTFNQDSYWVILWAETQQSTENISWDENEQNNMYPNRKDWPGCSEGNSSVAFKVLIINCQIYFINLFIFNCLTLSTKLFIFKLLDVKFLFSKNRVFGKKKRMTCLWSYGHAHL